MPACTSTPHWKRAASNFTKGDTTSVRMEGVDPLSVSDPWQQRVDTPATSAGAMSPIEFAKKYEHVRSTVQTAEEFNAKYGVTQGATSIPVPQSWGGSGTMTSAPPGLEETMEGPSGSGGKLVARPTTDEPAPKRNPAAKTPLTKIQSPLSGSSGNSAEYTVVDVREFGVQTEEGTRPKTSIK